MPATAVVLLKHIAAVLATLALVGLANVAVQTVQGAPLDLAVDLNLFLAGAAIAEGFLHIPAPGGGPGREASTPEEFAAAFERALGAVLAPHQQLTTNAAVSALVDRLGPEALRAILGVLAAELNRPATAPATAVAPAASPLPSASVAAPAQP
jgi:hypothetical protein